MRLDAGIQLANHRSMPAAMKTLPAKQHSPDCYRRDCNRITTASTKKRLISLGAHRYRNVHHRRAFSWNWFIVNVARLPAIDQLQDKQTSFWAAETACIQI